MTPPPGFTFVMAKRVRWAEVDPQSVVFNANYLTYADIGFTEYMRALGRPFPGVTGGATEIFAVRAEVDFMKPARFDDEIAIAVRTARIGRSSITVEIEILRGEERLTGIRNVYVHADPAAAKSLPLPPALVDAILAYEATPPER